MEFHGSAADLDRLFVVEDAALERFEPTEIVAEPDDAEPSIDLDSTDEHPILVLDERDELPEEPAWMKRTRSPRRKASRSCSRPVGPIGGAVARSARSRPMPAAANTDCAAHPDSR